MNFIQEFFQCITGCVNDDPPAATASQGCHNTIVSEKSNIHLSGLFRQSSHTAATNAVLTLQGAEKAGHNLEAVIEDIVTQAGGWTERIAMSILAMLENLLKEGSPMGQAMREAYDKACDAAASLAEFVHEHPILCTVIALGILVILAPAVIHALGFGALGPIEGKIFCRLVAVNVWRVGGVWIIVFVLAEAGHALLGGYVTADYFTLWKS